MVEGSETVIVTSTGGGSATNGLVCVVIIEDDRDDSLKRSFSLFNNILSRSGLYWGRLF